MHAKYFFVFNFSKFTKSFHKKFRWKSVLTIWISDDAPCFVGPHLDPNYLQRWSLFFKIHSYQAKVERANWKSLLNFSKNQLIQHFSSSLKWLWCISRLNWFYNSIHTMYIHILSSVILRIINSTIKCVKAVTVAVWSIVYDRAVDELRYFICYSSIFPINIMSLM